MHLPDSLAQPRADYDQATTDLTARCREIAIALENSMPIGMHVSGDSGVTYCVRRVQSNIGSAIYLYGSTSAGDSYALECDSDDEGYYLHRDFGAWIPAPTDEQREIFLSDVAAGLIERIAAVLNDRAVTIRSLLDATTGAQSAALALTE